MTWKRAMDSNPWSHSPRAEEYKGSNWGEFAYLFSAYNLQGIC